MPPLLRILRLNWVRYRAARRTLPLLSDAASRKNFMRHFRRNLSFTRLSVPTDRTAPPFPLRLDPLGGTAIHCRSGLADLGVVYDTFVGRYHLPPPELGAPRTILDLGSNIGLTIAHYAALYPEARIHGVELDRDNFELCRRNIRHWGPRCTVENAAVWREPGEVPYGGVRESGYTVVTGAGTVVKDRVRAVTVASVLDALGVETVDFVKMDIEGAEKEVLGDAGAWIHRVRCLKVEVHPEKASTLYTLGMCLDDLENYGLRCRLDERHHACVIAYRPE